jgi:hypothetical protein
MHHELAWLVSSDDRVEESSVFLLPHLGGIMVCRYAGMQVCRYAGMQVCSYAVRVQRAQRAQVEYSTFESALFEN